MTRPEPLWFHEPAMGPRLRLATLRVPPDLWRGPEETEHRWRYRQSDHTEPHGERVQEEWWECSICGEMRDGSEEIETKCFAGVGGDGDTQRKCERTSRSKLSDSLRAAQHGKRDGSRFESGTPASDEQPTETGEATGNDEIPF